MKITTTKSFEGRVLNGEIKGNIVVLDELLGTSLVEQKTLTYSDISQLVHDLNSLLHGLQPPIKHVGTDKIERDNYKKVNNSSENVENKYNDDTSKIVGDYINNAIEFSINGPSQKSTMSADSVLEYLVSNGLVAYKFK